MIIDMIYDNLTEGKHRSRSVNTRKPGRGTALAIGKKSLYNREK